MLQSFPAESNGRRKKLQEVKHQLFTMAIQVFTIFCSPNVYTLFLSLLCMVGWLRDSYMLYVFPHQVYHGKVTHKHITYRYVDIHQFVPSWLDWIISLLY